MRFTAKAFAIIGSVAFIAIGESKLLNYLQRNICHMQRHVPTGRFSFDGNKNCELRGRDYNGRICDNRNCDMNCVESSVEILDNRNLDADIVRSTVKVINESNCKLSARASNIEMRYNHNNDIDAEDAWCKFEDNHNLEYKGNGGVTQFLSKYVDNRNCDVSGKNNNISAFSNNNLTIAGDNNNLEISKTRNHKVQTAAVGSNGNSLTVTSSGINSIQFTIEYVGAAVINEQKYQLGIFAFDAVTIGDKVNVTLKGADDVTYSVVDSSSSKLVLRAEKNAVVETLKLSGDRVETVSINSINLFVNFV